MRQINSRLNLFNSYKKMGNIINPYMFRKSPLITDGLLRYYNLDEDYKDSFGGIYHFDKLTPPNGIPKFGAASHLSELSGSLIIASSVGLPIGTAARSISVWVYRTGTVANDLGAIVGWGDPILTIGRLFYLSISKAGNAFLWGDTNNYTSSHIIPLNTWTHLVVTFSGTSIKVFKNGVADVGGTISLNTSLGPLRLSRASINYYGFPGYIDDICIFSKILSQSEITALANE